jgi:hypothetical protein
MARPSTQASLSSIESLVLHKTLCEQTLERVALLADYVLGIVTARQHALVPCTLLLRPRVSYTSTDPFAL